MRARRSRSASELDKTEAATTENTSRRGSHAHVMCNTRPRQQLDPFSLPNLRVSKHKIV